MSVPSRNEAKERFQRPKAGEIEDALNHVEWDEDLPFSSTDFERLDKTNDTIFYQEPKFVEHIDEAAQRALQRFYKEQFTRVSLSRYADERNLDVLDIGSSWVSHFPPAYDDKRSRVAGLGMNSKELARNPQLTEYVVKDLNGDPTLPYEDASFDVVTIALTIDYLIRPLQVMEEVYRVLRQEGSVLVVFSNRLFLTKAVGVWTGKTDDDHAYTVGAYIHYSGKPYRKLRSLNISPRRDSDPLYAVIAEKE